FALLYVPAMASVLATSANQRLGDLAAGTLVIRDKRPAPPEPFVPTIAVPSSVDATGVSDREIAIVRSFLARREQLSPHARQEIAGELAAKLRPRVAGIRASADEAFLEQLAAAKGNR